MQHPDALVVALMALCAAIVLLGAWRARRGWRPYVRPIPVVAALEDAVGRATELDRPVYFVMGASDVRDIATHAALAILEHVARLAAVLRTTLVALVRKPDVYPFTESVMRTAYRAADALESFDPQGQVRYLSDAEVVYALSVVRLVEDTQPGGVLFFGSFDYTSLLMTEPGARLGVFQIAGDPMLGQVPFFVCTCDYALLGEEFFAASALVSDNPALRGMIASQDAIKLLLMLLVLVGVAAGLLAALGVPGADAIFEHLTKYAAR